MIIKESRASIYNSNSFLNSILTQVALVITFDEYYEGKEYQVSSKQETYVGTVNSSHVVVVNLKHKFAQYSITCSNRTIKVFIEEDITNVVFEKGTILTITFYDVYKNKPYSIFQQDKEIYKGIVDNSLTLTKTLEQLDTLYTITCDHKTVKKFFKEAIQNLLFDAATLTLTFDNFYLNKNIIITGPENENYEGIVDNSLTSQFSLQQIGSSYNINCDYKTINFTLESDTYNIDFNTMPLTINFDEHYLEKIYTISASNGQTYSGTIDNTLIVRQKLQQQGVQYNITCSYKAMSFTSNSQSNIINFNTLPLTINFNNYYLGKTYTISTSNGQTYNGIVDDTLVAIQKLQQQNTQYTVVCDYKTINFTSLVQGNAIIFNVISLTINFDESLEGKIYTISASNGQTYSGTIDNTLIVRQQIEQENTLYTISCHYGYREISPSLSDESYNYTLSLLTINFDESFKGFNYTISAPNGQTYNGVVDDTLTITQKLEQINTTYTVSCNDTSNTVVIGNTPITTTLEFIPIINAYEINAVSGAAYGFSLTSDGWWQSNNYNVNNSYAICQINLVTRNGATLTLSCISNGENNYDFGLISQVDKALSLSSSVDSTSYLFKSFKGLSSTASKTITMSIPAGEHTVYMKYRKDSSVHNGLDRFKFKVISFE